MWCAVKEKWIGFPAAGVRERCAVRSCAACASELICRSACLLGPLARPARNFSLSSLAMEERTSNSPLHMLLAEWRHSLALGTRLQLQSLADDAAPHACRAAELKAQIERCLHSMGIESPTTRVALIERMIRDTEAARIETLRLLPGEDPAVLNEEVGAAVAELLRDVQSLGH